MSEKPPIKVTKMIELLRSCYDKHADAPECADNIEVEFWIGELPASLKSIGQFSVKPDVTITLECEALTASLSRETALVEALELALSRLAHKVSCYSARPTSEWAEHGSVSFANCDCEIRTIRTALKPAA